MKQQGHVLSNAECFFNHPSKKLVSSNDERLDVSDERRSNSFLLDH